MQIDPKVAVPKRAPAKVSQTFLDFILTLQKKFSANTRRVVSRKYIYFIASQTAETSCGSTGLSVMVLQIFFLALGSQANASMQMS